MCARPDDFIAEVEEGLREVGDGFEGSDSDLDLDEQSDSGDETVWTAEEDGERPPGRRGEGKRTRLNGLCALSKKQMLSRLYSLLKLKGIIGYAVRQSAIPTSRTRKKQYGAFGEVILSISQDDFDSARQYCDSIKSAISAMEMETHARHADQWEKRHVPGPCHGVCFRMSKSRCALPARRLHEGEFGPKGKRTHHLCGCCHEYVPARGPGFHNWKNCDKRPQVVTQEQLVGLSLRLDYSRNDRATIRYTVGRGQPTEKAYLAARKKMVLAMPPTVLCADEFSVTTCPVANLIYAFSLPHWKEIIANLPKGKHNHILVTGVSNDGTTMRDKKNNRSMNAMLQRTLSFGREVAQSLDYVNVLGLWECTETNETFLEMFNYNKPYAAQFKKYFAENFGFKKHIVLLICDGARCPLPAARRA